MQRHHQHLNLNLRRPFSSLILPSENQSKTAKHLFSPLSGSYNLPQCSGLRNPVWLVQQVLPNGEEQKAPGQTGKDVCWEEVELLGHLLTLCLTVWRTVKLFPKWLCHFICPSVMYAGYITCKPLQTFPVILSRDILVEASRTFCIFFYFTAG